MSGGQVGTPGLFVIVVMSFASCAGMRGQGLREQVPNTTELRPALFVEFESVIPKLERLIFAPQDSTATLRLSHVL
ncbi:hypothetical protein RSOLAG22IIIB_05770 [Rhizoctonia solani]|uniref:Uncharacterized protein n=1 Tax=Rhizoctonia solani TaxID=456999 RepID=A0A0K6GA04_9AGAM|nr:hypothetical protein RSOLAG22IIIB_05770 [Rhizoctonia solani]